LNNDTFYIFNNNMGCLCVYLVVGRSIK